MSEPKRLTISTHVLDTGRGVPAEGIDVYLERMDPDGVHVPAGRGCTDADGRITSLLDVRGTESALHPNAPTTFCIRFATDPYWKATGQTAFYPQVVVTFRIEPNPERLHYHVPLLLDRFSYTTYRGT